MHSYFHFWILQLLAMLLTILLIPKLRISGLAGTLFLVGAIALVNAFLWDPALFYAIPDAVSLQAFLLLLANGVIFWMLVKLVPGIEVEGLTPAIAAPVVFTACSILVNRYGSTIDWTAVFKVLSEAIVGIFGTVREYFQTAPQGTPV